MANKNIEKFYEMKLAETEKYRENLKEHYGLTGETVEIARKIFRSRYSLITSPAYYDRRSSDLQIWQVDHTSDMCLKALTGDKYDEYLPDRMKMYDALKCHVAEIEDCLDDESALLIGGDEIGIGLAGGGECEFFLLTDDYSSSLGYIDPDWEPDAEKKGKCMAYWKENGMI